MGFIPQPPPGPRTFTQAIIEVVEKAQNLRCDYCGSIFKPDSRGNCACCGAPASIDQGIAIENARAVISRRLGGFLTPNEAREMWGLEKI